MYGDASAFTSHNGYNLGHVKDKLVCDCLAVIVAPWLSGTLMQAEYACACTNEECRPQRHLLNWREWVLGMPYTVLELNNV